MSLLEKKKGDIGLFLFEKGKDSCLLIDLKMIEEKHQEAMKEFEESKDVNHAIQVLHEKRIELIDLSLKPHDAELQEQIAELKRLCGL